MGNVWEIFQGNTSEFAIKLAFLDDPDEEAAIDGDAGASWGKFQIWAKGRNLCLHYEEGETVDAAYWYLLPLIQWFIRNWDPLLHEEKLPAQNAAYSAWSSLKRTAEPPRSIETDEKSLAAWESQWSGWFQRHGLLSCREGGLFPDLVIRRRGDDIEFSWGPTRSAGMPDHYQFACESGCAYVPVRSVAEPLHQVLLGAIKELNSRRTESSRIKELLRTAENIVRGNEDDRLMWLAGLGTAAATIASRWRHFRQAAQQRFDTLASSILNPENISLAVTGSCQAAMMFGSVSPDIEESDLLTLARIMIEHTDSGESSRPSDEYVSPEPLNPWNQSPWRQGYELADRFCDQTGMPGESESFVDIEAFLSRLSIPFSELDLCDSSVRGVAIAGSRHRPGIFFNARHETNHYPSGKRFTLAHELCHILYDRSYGCKLALVSGPWAPQAIEQRANAFAAWILMPPVLLDKTIARSPAMLASNEGILELAGILHVSRSSLVPHLQNLGYITHWLRDEIDGQNDQNGAAVEI